MKSALPAASPCWMPRSVAVCTARPPAPSPSWSAAMRKTYNTVKPMLDAIGAHVVYCGEIGNGMVTKICNNLLSMGIGVLMSEALTLGVKAGVSLETLADVIANSSGGNRRLTEKFPRYLFSDNFEPGFATALAAKDVRLATDLGREYGIPMELSNLVDQRHVESPLPRLGSRGLRRRRQASGRKIRRPAPLQQHGEQLTLCRSISRSPTRRLRTGIMMPVRFCCIVPSNVL